MGNPITDAVISGIASSMDPMASMTRQFIAGQMKTQDSELRRLAREELAELQKDKAAAKDAGADKAVMDAYDALISAAVKAVQRL